MTLSVRVPVPLVFSGGFVLFVFLLRSQSPLMLPFVTLVSVLHVSSVPRPCHVSMSTLCELFPVLLW